MRRIVRKRVPCREAFAPFTLFERRRFHDTLTNCPLVLLYLIKIEFSDRNC